MKNKTLASIFLLTLNIACPIYALEGSIALDFSGGPIKGFTQVPRGGDFFSTSFERPTMAEIDLDHNFYYDIDFDLKHNNVVVIAEFNKIKTNGRNPLTEALATHGQYIPAGNEFKLKVHYDWYRFGLGRSFDSDNKRWTITPLIIANYLKFNYHFYSWPIASTRNYNLMAGMFGLAVNYKINTKLKANALGSATLPLSNLTMYHALIDLEYSLIDTPAMKLIPRIGLELIEIDYRDEQPIPNHVSYEAKPHLFAGLKLYFC